MTTDPETGLAAPCTYEEVVQVCGELRALKRTVARNAADLIAVLYEALEQERRAALARPDAGEDGARRFAGLVLEYSRDNDFVDVDAGSIQDWALDCGLLEGVRVTEACGECCACAESDDFPQTCIRYSEAGIRVRSAARKGAEENGR
jgi:hypothetical protein